MPSLAELTPRERARLLGKPEGELGIAIAKNMNQTNAASLPSTGGSACKPATACSKSASPTAARCRC
jgi:hypothetical protein